MADMMAPAPEMADAVAEPTTPTAQPVGRTPKKFVDNFRMEISAAKTNRRTFSQEWKTNVDLRLGRSGAVYAGGLPTSDEDMGTRAEINPDWSLTKTKTANLYSQTPSVQLSHENEAYAPALAPFAKALNYELGDKRANIGVPMEEVLNDVVNASGVGGILVGYMARYETVQMPSVDMAHLPPDQQQLMMQSGQVSMVPVQRVSSYKFFGSRVSPTDLLWPKSFKGSNFDDADWVGHTGLLSWSEAALEFKLTEAQKESVLEGDEPKAQDDLRADGDRGQTVGFENVKFDEIFYWRYKIDPLEPNLKAIWRMVFVEGIDQPVIDEPWIGQKKLPGSSQLIGAMKFPLQFLTLTYISDNPIPPSDSAAGRPQVNDLRQSRRQMFMNRDRSRPLRWFDTNRVDRMVQDNLMRGDWQGFIPTNGPGDRSIGEIARATYPPEDMAFDRQTQADLMASWQIGPNQAGTVTTGEKTKAEIDTTQANFATRIGQERGRVQRLLLNVAEILGSLMALYSDFPNLSPEERQRMQGAWNMKQILSDLVFKVRPDSTIMLDVNQQIDRLTKLLNITAQSGLVDVAQLIAEIAELSGKDPATLMKKPEPPAPQEATMSFRFTGKEDLWNPVVMGLLVKNKQAPSPEDMATAEKILQAAAAGVAAVAPPQALQPKPEAPTPTNGEPNSTEDYGLAPKVAQRSADMGNA